VRLTEHERCDNINEQYRQRKREPAAATPVTLHQGRNTEKCESKIYGGKDCEKKLLAMEKYETGVGQKLAK